MKFSNVTSIVFLPYQRKVLLKSLGSYTSGFGMRRFATSNICLFRDSVNIKQRSFAVPFELVLRNQKDKQFYCLEAASCSTSLLLSPAFRASYTTIFVPDRSFHNGTVVLYAEKDTSKPSSQVEVTVQDLEEKTRAAASPAIHEAPKTQVEVKKSLGTRIKEEILHYYSGFKLLFMDVRLCSHYVWRLLNGDVLSRRENRQLIRTTSDLFRLVPFSVFVIVPFMEFLLPVAIKLFPGMLPSTFETTNEKEAKIKKKLKVKLEMAKFLQKTLDSMAVEAKGHYSESARAFVEFFNKVQKTGEPISTTEILQFSKLFKDEITLDSLSRPQLVALCRLIEMQPFGTNNFLRFQLRMKLRSLAADDRIIQHEGIESLAVWELQQTCRTRGMRAYGLSKERLQQQLQQWLDLSLNEKVPPSLLLLSRTLYLPDKLLPEETLAATISTLPEEVAQRTKASIGKKEGKIDNVTRLEIIKSEEKKIKEDKREREEEKKKLEETLSKKKAAEVPEKEPVVATTISAEKVLALETHEELPEEEKQPTEITAKDIDSVENALEIMELEKKRAFIEAQELSELKSELADYEEDIQDFKTALTKAGLDEKSLHESKAARRLFSLVKRMVTKIDPVVGALHKEKETLQKIMEDEASKEKEQALAETDLINLEELTNHLKYIVDVSDAAKVKKIHSVLSKMDDDMDGAIKAEHVHKVLQLLSEDQENLSSKLFEEVVEMMLKEEQMEAQALIRKALELPRIRAQKKESSVRT